MYTIYVPGEAMPVPERAAAMAIKRQVLRIIVVLGRMWMTWEPLLLSFPESVFLYILNKS